MASVPTRKERRALCRRGDSTLSITEASAPKIAVNVLIRLHRKRDNPPFLPELTEGILFGFFSHLLFLLFAAKVPNVSQASIHPGNLNTNVAVTPVALLWSVPA